MYGSLSVLRVPLPVAMLLLPLTTQPLPRCALTQVPLWAHCTHAAIDADGLAYMIGSSNAIAWNPLETRSTCGAVGVQHPHTMYGGPVS